MYSLVFTSVLIVGFGCIGKNSDYMTEKQLVEGLSFEEYLRRNPMPTKLLDNENYKIIEIKERDCE